MMKVGEVRRNASGEFVFEPSLSESELWPGDYDAVTGSIILLHCSNLSSWCAARWSGY